MGHRCIARGELDQLALQVKQVADQSDPDTILIFDQVSSRPIELDLRGTPEQVLDNLRQWHDLHPIASADPNIPVRRGPGRPKLGVVSREVTLLPRHWAWLKSQPGSASP